jgi:hypothetical protein
MSGGKRFKFQGSTIAVTVGFDAVSPSKAITGITQAKPAVAHVVGHGFVDGDVVLVTGVVGMIEVNDQVYIIQRVDSDHFDLVDTDSTGYTAYTSGGHADEGQFSNWCELTGYNHQGGTKTEIDASNLCSTAKEFELGLADFGTTQFDFHFAPQTPIQLAMARYNLSGDAIAVKVTLPKSGGLRTQIGFITQMSETASVNGMWTASMTIRNTGAPFDQAGT